MPLTSEHSRVAKLTVCLGTYDQDPCNTLKNQGGWRPNLEQEACHPDEGLSTPRSRPATCWCGFDGLDHVASRQSRHDRRESAVFLLLEYHGESHSRLPLESFVHSAVTPLLASAVRSATAAGGRFPRGGQSLPRPVPSAPRRASRGRRHGCR